MKMFVAYDIRHIKPLVYFPQLETSASLVSVDNIVIG